MTDDSTASSGLDRSRGTVQVASGIFLSRVVGFVRERAFAYYFGVGAHVDVFKVALRGPNLLQNLLGEGSLSASFIPIYSRMLEEGRPRDAGRFAGAVFGLLLALAGGIALAGMALAEPLVAVLSTGFLAREDPGGVDRFDLTVRAVRIIFPMTGVLVLSAWALGVLNSHRKFFLPYVAPVLWNLSILAALFGGAAYLAGDALTPQALGLEGSNRLILAACFGALGGGVLQLLIQLPAVWRVLKGFRLSFSTRVEGVGEALRAFGPVVAGRSVYQLSAYLDIWLAGWLHVGAVAALGFAAQIYVLPVALFGLSVAAAELPEMSRLVGERRAEIPPRIRRSLARMGFLVIPTFVGYLAFGFLIVGLLYRTGDFGLADNGLVYLVLAGYSLGLPATTTSRLLQNSFYALGDTATPARIAGVRVLASAAVGVPAMVWLDRFSATHVLGLEGAGASLFLGAVGLALGSAVGAWAELVLLLRGLGRRLPEIRLPGVALGRMLALALAAAIPAAAAWYLLPAFHVALVAVLVLGLYAVVYLGLAWLLRPPELEAWTGRFLGSSRNPS